MRLVLIVAHDQALVIGNKGALPWKLPEDMKHFRETTMGHPILMGRGVWEELGQKPLPGRLNVVVSRQTWPNVLCFSSVDDALAHLRDHPVVYVIGGAKLYTSLLSRIDEMIITEVDGVHEGDVHFPEYREDIGSVWREVSRTPSTGLSFIRYERISKVA
jgi:dihydrofolate reductase